MIGISVISLQVSYCIVVRFNKTFHVGDLGPNPLLERYYLL